MIQTKEGRKIYDASEIMKVTKDLEKHGAKCEVFVAAVKVEPGLQGLYLYGVGYILDVIKVKFPDGRRWDIVDIDTDEVRVLG